MNFDVTFQEAVEAMEEGFFVSREAWAELGLYLAFRDGDCVQFVERDGVLTQSADLDILDGVQDTRDWQIYSKVV